MHNEKPSDHDTKVQNHTIEAQVHNDVVHDREGAHTQDAAPTQSEMKSVKEESESTKPITATAITTTTTSTTADVMMENSTEKATTNQINESHSNSTTPKESESESKPNASASVVEDQQQPTRKSSFGTSKSFRAEDSLFETALLLGKLPYPAAALLPSFKICQAPFHFALASLASFPGPIPCFSILHAEKLGMGPGDKSRGVVQIATGIIIIILPNDALRNDFMLS